MNALDSAWFVVPLVTAFVSTLVGTWKYRSLAIRRAIVANPNFRSLHERPTPRGAGVVFAFVCILLTAALWLEGGVSSNLARAVIGGGAVAALIGFVDDTRHLPARWKLLTQAIVAAWILFCFDVQPLLHLPGILSGLDLALSWLGLVWLMNVYNFMDGIDGMAAAGAVFVSTASILAIGAAGIDMRAPSALGPELVLALLAVSTLAFLFFNWPPASVFMGDAGSLFLGVTFGALIANTILAGQMSLWTWSILFGYFLGDTTTTLAVRIFLTPRWYEEHRSHAYQNLARISSSHRSVVMGVSLYHVLWLLPLAVWSILSPATAPVAAILAFLPVVAWTLRHGPLRSNA
jgi:Fuc2NAc and GlcNAc transferase